MTASALPKGTIVRTLKAWKTIVRKKSFAANKTLPVKNVIMYLSWGFEAQPHTFVVAGELFLGLLGTISDQNTLLVLEDGGLFLISPFGL